MGYRSDAICLIYPAEGSATPTTAIKVLLASRFSEVLSTFKECFDWPETDDDMVVFQCRDVKWYASYPDVAAFEAMRHTLHELGLAHEFGLIGEDDNDLTIERSEGSHYRLGIERKFTY